MRRSYKIPLLVAMGLLTVLAVAAAYSTPTVSFQSAARDGVRMADVLMGERPVIVLQTAAGGLTPLERAEVVAGRLRTALATEVKPEEVAVTSISMGAALSISNQMIVAIYQGEADAHKATPTALAKLWRENILLALGYSASDLQPTAPPADPASSTDTSSQQTVATPAQESATPSQPAAPSVDWTGTAQKWVPILSVDRDGLQIGAAQIAGPTTQVNEVKGVAEVRLTFESIGRIYAYVPVRTLSVTKLDRVQGVSVWATGELQLVNF